MVTELIDTHCHLDDTQFDVDRDAILIRCRHSGITRIIVPAIHRGNWDKVLTLCNTNEGLYPALGLHPLFIDQHKQSDITDLQKYLDHHPVIAIGEIGLDFYNSDTDRNKQITFLEKQLDMAQQRSLPVLLHVRKAHNEMLRSLKKFSLTGGIAHAFNGSLEQARDYMSLGFKLGFGGVITYEGSTRIRRLARELPLESIVLETDAPDMSGAAHRGQRNSPEYLTEALTALAEIRQQDASLIAAQTTRNAAGIFNYHMTESHDI